MRLHELSTELSRINDELISADGEISPELESRLDQVNLALTQKAQGLRKWLANIDADDKAVDDEIKRLQRIKDVKENLRSRLEAYIKHNMEVAGIKKIGTPIGTFTIAKSPESVEIIDAEMVPDDFKRVIPEQREPDKKKIKEAFQEGYEVPGAKLITDRTNLRIK